MFKKCNPYLLPIGLGRERAFGTQTGKSKRKGCFPGKGERVSWIDRFPVPIIRMADVIMSER
jgi:hypothetical protein